MITCPRCHEQVDGSPSGCRDPACPTLEIEELERQQYNSIMADVKAESVGNVAYNAAKDVVIAAAQRVIIVRDQDLRGLRDALTELARTIAALNMLEKPP